MSETIELADRVRDETTVQLSSVVVNRVLPELFGRQEEAVFEELASAREVSRLDELVGGATAPVLEAARLAVTLRRTRADPPRPAARRHRSVGPDALSPVPVQPVARSANHPSGRSLPRRGARLLMRFGRPRAQPASGEGEGRPLDPVQLPQKNGSMDGLLATKEIVIACGPGGRGEDDHRRGRRGDGRGHPGHQGAGADRRPGKAAGRRARSRRASATSSTASPTRPSLPRAFAREASCGRPCSTPRSPGTPSSANTHPTPGRASEILANPLYQNISGRFVQSHDYIAMERLYEIHSRGRLRPDRRRHAADPQRARLPRCPEAAWPTSSPRGSCGG